MLPGDSIYHAGASRIIPSSHVNEEIQPPPADVDLDQLVEETKRVIEELIDAKNKQISRILQALSKAVEANSSNLAMVKSLVSAAQEKINQIVSGLWDDASFTPRMQAEMQERVAEALSSDQEAVPAVLEEIKKTIQNQLLEQNDAGDFANSRLTQPPPSPPTDSESPPPPSTESEPAPSPSPSSTGSDADAQSLLQESLLSELRQQYGSDATPQNIGTYSNTENLKQLCDAFFHARDFNSAETAYQAVMFALQGGTGDSASAAAIQAASANGSDGQLDSLLNQLMSGTGEEQSVRLGVIANALRSSGFQWSPGGAALMNLILQAINQLGDNGSLNDLETWLTDLGDPAALYPKLGSLTQTDFTQIINSLDGNPPYQFPLPGSPRISPPAPPPAKAGYIPVRIDVPYDQKASDVYIRIQDKNNWYRADGSLGGPLTGPPVPAGANINLSSAQQDPPGHYYIYVPVPITSGQIITSVGPMPDVVPSPSTTSGILWGMTEITADANNAYVDYSGVDQINMTATVSSQTTSSGIPLPDEVSGTTENRNEIVQKMMDLMSQYGWTEDQIKALLRDPDNPDLKRILSPKNEAGPGGAFATYYQKYLEETLLNSKSGDSIEGLQFEATDLTSPSTTIDYTCQSISKDYITFVGRGHTGASVTIKIPCNTADGACWFSGGHQGEWSLPPASTGTGIIAFTTTSDGVNHTKIPGTDADMFKGPSDLIRDLTVIVNLGMDPNQLKSLDGVNGVVSPTLIENYIAIHGSAGILYQPGRPYNAYERAAQAAGFNAYAFDYDEWTGQSGLQQNPLADLSCLKISLGEWGPPSTKSTWQDIIQALEAWGPAKNSPAWRLEQELIAYIKNKEGGHLNDPATLSVITKWLDGKDPAMDPSDIYYRYPGLMIQDLNQMVMNLNQIPGGWTKPTSWSPPGMTNYDKALAEIALYSSDLLPPNATKFITDLEHAIISSGKKDPINDLQAIFNNVWTDYFSGNKTQAALSELVDFADAIKGASGIALTIPPLSPSKIPAWADIIYALNQWTVSPTSAAQSLKLALLSWINGEDGGDSSKKANLTDLVSWLKGTNPPVSPSDIYYRFPGLTKNDLDNMVVQLKAIPGGWSVWSPPEMTDKDKALAEIANYPIGDLPGNSTQFLKDLEDAIIFSGTTLQQVFDQVWTKYFSGSQTQATFSLLKTFAGAINQASNLTPPIVVPPVPVAPSETLTELQEEISEYLAALNLWSNLSPSQIKSQIVMLEAAIVRCEAGMMSWADLAKQYGFSAIIPPGKYQEFANLLVTQMKNYITNPKAVLAAREVFAAALKEINYLLSHGGTLDQLHAWADSYVLPPDFTDQNDIVEFGKLK